MQAVRRSATPLRVQHIWNVIAKVASSEAADLEKLVDIAEKMHKIPKEELNHELEMAIKDGLVRTDVGDGSNEEVETYKLPDPEAVEKGDRDWYCFHCHLGGSVIKCEDCPRVYHLDCLPDERKPDKDLFICPACQIMSTKPSAEKLIGLKQKQLNQLIEYICERFTSWNAAWMEEANGASWAQALGRSEKDAWRYDMLVYLPMDLKTMQGKADDAKYTSLEEFQVDCETFVHNMGVYFGLDILKANQLGASFYRDAMHDIGEIKLCHQCFQRSNEKNHDWWFCLPCNPQHEVVYAKQSGYPYWPAKVMKREGNKYDVRYFGGGYERGNIDAKNIQDINTPLTKLKVRKNALWNEAFDELQKFLDLAKNPSNVSALPSRGKAGGSAKKASNKRAAAESPALEPAVAKKRKSEPAPASVSTPKLQPKKTAASAKAVLKAKDSSKTNGDATPTSRKSASSVKSDKRDSTKNETSTTSKKGKLDASTKTSSLNGVSLDSLDPDLKSIILENDNEDSLGGDVSFSDDDASEPSEKVSEDAVSSSCNEGKTTRNAYIQVGRPGTLEINVQRLIDYVNTMKENHKTEIDANKKKQWCYNCGREAIYHCCWNTAYCSIECQQQHWTSEHKRLCRRVRRGGGTTHDDY